jgi:hypothetical protein
MLDADPQSLPNEPEFGLGQTDPHASAPQKSRSTGLFARCREALSDYFTQNDPVFPNAFPPAMFVAALLYVRSPTTNCIFDEQEALLANPYVNGINLRFFEAFRRDFWGLPSTRSIGSYRPIPNLVWRTLWPLGNSPWLLHWVNVVVHAACASLLASFVWAVTKQRKLAWWTGLVYVTFALLTEAVSGVVGLADMLGALFLLLALHALRLPWFLSGLAVFVSVLAGLFSKESELVAIPLVLSTALFTVRAFHPHRPFVIPRSVVALVGAVGALILYTELRKRLFPVELPAQLAQPPDVFAPWYERAMHGFLRWFRQPRLPSDPMNNPLVSADLPHRVAGALRVYASGLGQLVFPLRLSGDYSFPAEPVPDRVVFPGSVAGAVGLLLPPMVALVGLPVVMFREWRSRRLGNDWQNALRGRSRLVLLGLLWVPVAYFPHSNIPTLLPTVRAERFWVIPAIGAAIVLGVVAHQMTRLLPGVRRRLALGLLGLWLGFQVVQARRHAFDYTDDLSFWRGTARATPNSAKARLNHAVMLGARQRLAERLTEGAHAIRLAPKWPMARIYQGDTLCRMDRLDEAWPYYRDGFELGPNEQNLVALALQCLWDKQKIRIHRDELQAMAEKHPGSWLAYLVWDILENGEVNKGVQPKYRPRGYNEGPKK